MNTSLLQGVVLIFALLIVPADAHEVFSEAKDFSQDKPFAVTDSIESAKAVYARLEPATDVDVYTFTVTGSVRVHARAFVPLVKGVEKFLPSLAVVGPGLPVAGEKLPFTVPQGYGAIVVNNTPPGVKRPAFFEVDGISYLV